MKQLFHQYMAWQAQNWDEPNMARSLLKFHEEVGELNAALYRADRPAFKDALADVVISLLGVAVAGGVNLPAEVEAVWREVGSRNYRLYPKNGRDQ